MYIILNDKSKIIIINKVPSQGSNLSQFWLFSSHFS